MARLFYDRVQCTAYEVNKIFFNAIMVLVIASF